MKAALITLKVHRVKNPVTLSLIGRLNSVAMWWPRSFLTMEKKQGLSSIPINVETSSVIIKPIVLGNLHQLVNEAGLTVKI